jgi:hypothetical protein
MSIQTFGKPKAILILSISGLVMIVSYIVLPSIKFAIGFSVLWCGTIVIAYLLRLRMYKKELRAFKNGEHQRRRCHVSIRRSIQNLNVYDRDYMIGILENIFTKHRMLWNGIGGSYIGFTNLFSSWPIKLEIEIIEEEGNQFSLSFLFADRFMQSNMIPWIEKRFKAEINRIYSCFNATFNKKES